MFRSTPSVSHIKFLLFIESKSFPTIYFLEAWGLDIFLHLIRIHKVFIFPVVCVCVFMVLSF